ncbi:bifunctional U3 small nucleolar RNA-associated protein 6/Tetratricopeptide-like helical domain superfamily [Babesia duncani]|uniref:Bifunctional U3 small nucleolar RNA-associated protein 6/Tetratricopeptide-like helical domain superfamily n=1 Tax=Babesia duncani TaxID=323732 RepID=A0AAD9PHD2_9APIC|nr:bifunctional U3 small nucleolar RNA-associated protein 6/Tetratricopeptide-like helical domain superfamily [Babesia duncani]KAK2195060.1 bifunctional U3 small nucleolar RNA-associated protein 6/Tetratricopeptide-like helical domain superfamily [Babesia duncani]
MGDKVQKQLEDMVPCMDLLVRKELFSISEIREVISKSRSFEYLTHSTDPSVASNGFRNFINYNINLDGLLQRRLREQRHLSTTRNDLSNSSSNRYNIKIPPKIIFRRRIHRLFKRYLNRFSGDVDMWQEYCSFCNKIKAIKVLDRVLMGALAKNPTCDGLWLIAVKYTKTYRGLVAATNLAQRSLRVNPKSLSLYIVLLELQVLHSREVFMHDSSNEGLNCKAWISIAKHALKNLDGYDILKFLFRATCICSKIQHYKDFTKALNDSFREFSEYVSLKMFDYRQQHPIMGLYIWQHRLLEAILLEKYKKALQVAPLGLWNEIIKDCDDCKGLGALACKFVNTVISKGTDVNVPSFVNSISADDDFSIELNFENQPDDDNHDTYGINTLLDICILKPIAADFDLKSLECKYTQGLVTRGQLVAAIHLFKEFFNGILKDLKQDIKPLLNSRSIESIDSTNPILQLIITVWKSKSNWTDSLKLLKTLSNIHDGAFDPLLQIGLVDYFKHSSHEESYTVDAAIMLLEFSNIDSETKVNLLRSCRGFKLDHQTILTMLRCPKQPSIDLLLVLVSKATDATLRNLITRGSSFGHELNTAYPQLLKDLWVHKNPPKGLEMAWVYLKIHLVNLHIEKIKMSLDEVSFDQFQIYSRDLVECCDGLIEKLKDPMLKDAAECIVKCLKELQEIGATLGMPDLLPNSLEADVVASIILGNYRQFSLYDS